MPGRARAGAGAPRLVRQLEIADCGAACLAMVLHAHGRRVPVAQLRDLTSTGRDGVSAAGILQAASRLGLDGAGVRCPAERLAELPRGAILHWGGNHFVVLDGQTRRGLRLLDPALGARVVPPSTVSEQYSGVALLLRPDRTAGAAPVSPSTPRSAWARYRPFLSGLGRPAALVLAFAAAVQLLTLLHPLVLRSVVNGVTEGAPPAPTTLALAVAALGGGFLLASVGRLLFLVTIQRLVDVGLTRGVLHHLASLPYAWLARRSTGDLAMRVRSTVAVRQILTSSALSACLDGVLVLGYLVVILVLDLELGALTAAAVLAQALVVVLSWSRLRQAAAESLEAQTTAQTHLVEMVTALELLKSTGGAREAVDGWLPSLDREVRAQAAASRLNGLVESLLTTLRFVAPSALLVLGLQRVLAGDLALGDMLALVALSAAVTVPTGALLSTVRSVSEVFSYLERLDDVLDAAPERGGTADVPRRLEGTVRLEDVSFRYSTLLPPALAHVSLEIAPGEHVAVVGGSGSGKSTLAMLIATLYDPTEGAVLLDGLSSRAVDRDALRRRIGVVPQSTTLFHASIRDNVVARRPGVSAEDVEHACRAAAVHDDIAALPSGYETLLGNGGAGLSGGQRQRLALARALVGGPGLLVLDEPTSALDTVTEQRVHDALSEMGCTRIVVGHRVSSARRADRVLVMAEGRLVADGSYRSVRRRSEHFRALVAADAAATGSRA